MQVIATDGAGHHVRAYYRGSSEGIGASSEPWSVQDDGGDDPSDEPPPLIVGEALACAGTRAASWFAPSQGVWQDDEDFADAPGKRLVWNDTEERWDAELAMVVARPTLLFGTRGQRDVIPYNVTLSGTQDADAKVRFQLYEFASGAQVVDIARWPTGDRWLRLNIAGGCGAPREHSISVDASQGLPSDAAPFLIRREGEYRMWAELVDRHDRPVPGTRVELHGENVIVPPTKVRFVGFSLDRALRMPREGEGEYLVPKPAGNDALSANVARLARDFDVNVEDIFPVGRGMLRAETDMMPASIVDMDAIARECQRDAALYTAPSLALGEFICTSSVVQGRLYGEAMRSVWIAGAKAALIVVPGGTYQVMQRAPAATMGEGLGSKLALLHENATEWIAAHEVAHVTPWLFSAETECGRDFHDVGETLAHGFRILHAGEEARAWRRDQSGLMDEQRGELWIEQCTYSGLLRELSSRRDPPLQALALRFVRLAGNATMPEGRVERVEILEGLTMDGEPDVLRGAGGTHGIVFRDAAGEEIARYGFTPVFANERGEARPDALVALRVERPPAAAWVDIEGPGDATLLTRALSSRPPAVHVRDAVLAQSDSFGNGTLVIEYGATPADGITYTLMSSADGGETWRTLVSRTAHTRALIEAGLFAPGQHLLRVVASDGLQSGEATAVYMATPGPGGAPRQGDPEADGPDAGAVPAAEMGLLLAAIAASAALAARRLTRRGLR